ncbi:hypothetical protein DEU56DRAFT_809348 [Suillus clintonianus]|uniref:uncharacterized protein n=1 Tax=Suillus clintonianus TaxID=1904413 RepID=UPI001B86F56C|nr:uncharacterized protein DEU56DRAFT_809348 [Suillus clintonianus]KAG2134489.1 hypothetical protein DEU56DRAFT_809348 [Suillus clintonianus]
MAQREDENVAQKQGIQQSNKSQGTCPSAPNQPPRPGSPKSYDILLASDVTGVMSDSAKITRHKRQLTPDSEPSDKQAKRSRTDTTGFRKHERFWLADGNAVIELDGISFRVHQSWIAKHSKRIAAMLPDKGKQCGRLHEITLDFQGPLKAIDLEALLLFYENPGDYRDYIETPTLMSLIRATTMLGFDSDRVWLVKELEALWPSALGELFVNPEPRLDAPEVAVLARVCEIDTLLKPAFYDMAITPGFGLGNLEESEQIGRADVLRLVQMREYLSDMWFQVAAHEDPAFVCPKLWDAPSSNGEESSKLSENADEKPVLCSTTPSSMGNCRSATARREAWVWLVHYSEIFARYRYDPLRGLTALINIKWTTDWCKDCREKRKADWRKMQRSIWEKVGEYLREN